MKMAAPQAAPVAAQPGRQSPSPATARIGPVDDPLEREADRIADAALSDRAIGSVGGETPGRTSASGGAAGSGQAAATTKAAAAVSSGGAPLSPRDRAYFEPRFGRDLSDVRIHTNDEAAVAADGIQARAFALGRNIAFAAGEYRPDAVRGQRLTAHELAHVIQGTQGADPHVIRRAPGDSPEFRVVSDVWSVADEDGVPRSVVIVESAGERKAFYERSGKSPRLEGHEGPKAGDWAPFDGFKDNGRGFGHFQKNLYFRGKMPNDPRYGYGDRENIQISEWLRDQRLPKPIPEHWTYVQSRLQSQGVHVLTPLDTPIAERLAPVQPKARTVSGEITTRSPGGGGPPANEASVIVSPHAGSSRSTVEHRGAPVEPIRNPARLDAKAALEGGAQALLSMQLGNIRGAEAEKAVKRLNELLGEADAHLSKGYGVAITLVMEVPDTIDLAAAITGIGDASQVVYFNRMFISQLDAPRMTTQAPPSKYPVVRANLAPGDPMQEDPHERTLDQQIRGQMGEKYPVEKYRPRKGFHFETRELRLGGQQTSKDRPGNLPAFGREVDYEAAAIRARPPAYVGTFHPDTLDQASVGGRHQSAISVGLYRLIQFHAVPANRPGFVEMWNLHYGTGSKTKYQTETTSGTGPSQAMSARFVEKADGKVYSFVESTFVYVSYPEVLIETARGGETNSNASNWSAVITWKRGDKAG